MADDANEPLTLEAMAGFLAEGAKPKDQWRIGAEHEKFGFLKDGFGRFLVVVVAEHHILPAS